MLGRTTYSQATQFCSPHTIISGSAILPTPSAKLPPSHVEDDPFPPITYKSPRRHLSKFSFTTESVDPRYGGLSSLSLINEPMRGHRPILPKPSFNDMDRDEDGPPLPSFADDSYINYRQSPEAIRPPLARGTSFSPNRSTDEYDIGVGNHTTTWDTAKVRGSTLLKFLHYVGLLSTRVYTSLPASARSILSYQHPRQRGENHHSLADRPQMITATPAGVTGPNLPTDIHPIPRPSLASRTLPKCMCITLASGKPTTIVEGTTKFLHQRWSGLDYVMRSWRGLGYIIRS